MPNEMNVVDCWRVIVRGKKFIVASVFLITICSAVYSLFLPNIYQSFVVLMPTSQDSGLSLGSLGGVLASLGAGGGGASQSTQLVVILKSQTLSEAMVKKYHLMEKVFHKDLWDAEKQQWKDPKNPPSIQKTAASLKSISKFVAEPAEKVIRITVTHKDPQVAAFIADGYVSVLDSIINDNSFTASKHKRLFVEKQLEKSRMDLLNAGKELSDFYSINNISNVIPKVDVDVSIKGSLASEVEEVVEIKEVDKKLSELQKMSENVGKKIDELKVVKAVPQQVYLQYLSLQRELLTQVNALLSQQYAMARIEEAKEDLHFNVIDYARVSSDRFKPNRRQIVLLSALVGAFGSIFILFVQEYIRSINKK